jgi:protein transport protein SEC24
LIFTACLPRYTSGQTYFYPAFNAARVEDAVKFARELGNVVAMPVMLEAVMRVRASRGIRSTNFYGNFFVMKTDLLAMPAVPQDQGYVVELELEETLTQPYVVFQTAIMHTTCFGERRIRVITSAVPTTTSMSEVFAGADEIALATLFANKAVERSLSHKLEDARDAIMNKTVELLNAYKASMTAGGAAAASQLAIADNMRMLPVLMLAILKSVAVRQSSQIPLDLRAYAQAMLTSLPTERLIPYLYPTFYSLHNMPPEVQVMPIRGCI